MIELTGLSGTMCLPTGRPIPERRRIEEATERETMPFPPMILDATLLNLPAIFSLPSLSLEPDWGFLFGGLVRFSCRVLIPPKIMGHGPSYERQMQGINKMNRALGPRKLFIGKNTIFIRLIFFRTLAKKKNYFELYCGRPKEKKILSKRNLFIYLFIYWVIFQLNMWAI